MLGRMTIVKGLRAEGWGPALGAGDSGLEERESGPGAADHGGATVIRPTVIGFRFS
jgi:hypothetical protein